jgi:hypothetical protein
MPTHLVFPPPYLDYDVPEDLKKIKAQIEAARPTRGTGTSGRFDFHGESASAFTEGTVSRGQFAFDPTKFVPSPADSPETFQFAGSRSFGAGSVARFQLPELGIDPTASTTFEARRSDSFQTSGIAQFHVVEAEAAEPSPAATSKVAADLITVTPSGTVATGFNCTRTFTATTQKPPSFTPASLYWKMYLSKTTGGITKTYFIGADSVNTVTSSFPYTVEFIHNFDTYSTIAYTSPSNTVTCIVECDFFDANGGLPVLTEKAAPIILDFSGPSCLHIHSMAVNKDTFVGGDNDKDPILTVALNAPAGPGGQKVQLTSSKPGLGWIHGDGSFVIPAGQSSGAISWFLGTREVITTGKSFHVQAVLVSPEGNSEKGVVEIFLTKKPKKRKWP